jgi:hypothetical protein
LNVIFLVIANIGSQVFRPIMFGAPPNQRQITNHAPEVEHCPLSHHTVMPTVHHHHVVHNPNSHVRYGASAKLHRALCNRIHVAA